MQLFFSLSLSFKSITTTAPEFILDTFMRLFPFDFHNRVQHWRALNSLLWGSNLRTVVHASRLIGAKIIFFIAQSTLHVVNVTLLLLRTFSRANFRLRRPVSPSQIPNDMSVRGGGPHIRARTAPLRFPVLEIFHEFWNVTRGSCEIRPIVDLWFHLSRSQIPF